MENTQLVIYIISIAFISPKNEVSGTLAFLVCLSKVFAAPAGPKIKEDPHVFKRSANIYQRLATLDHTGDEINFQKTCKYLKGDFNRIDKLFEVIHTIEKAKAESLSALAAAPKLQTGTISPEQKAFLKDALGVEYENILTEFQKFETLSQTNKDAEIAKKDILDYRKYLEKIFDEEKIRNLEDKVAALKQNTHKQNVLAMPNSISILACFETLASEAVTIPVPRENIKELRDLVVKLLKDPDTRKIGHDFLLKTYYLVEILTGGQKLAENQIIKYSEIYPLIEKVFSMRPIFYRVSSFILLFHGCDDSEKDCGDIENILSLAPDPVILYIEATAKQISEPTVKSGDSWKDKNLKHPFQPEEILQDNVQLLVICYNSYIHFFNAPETPKHNLKCIFDSYDSKLSSGPHFVLLQIFNNLKNDQQDLFMKLLDESMYYIAQDYENNREVVMNPILQSQRDEQKKMRFPFAFVGMQVQDFSLLKSFFCCEQCGLDLTVISKRSEFSKHLICPTAISPVKIIIRKCIARISAVAKGPSRCVANILRLRGRANQDLFESDSDCSDDIPDEVECEDDKHLKNILTSIPCDTIGLKLLIEDYSDAEVQNLRDNLEADTSLDGSSKLACFISGTDQDQHRILQGDHSVIDYESMMIAAETIDIPIDPADDTARHNADQKLHNIVTYRKLMNADIFTKQLQSLTPKELDLITNAGFNAAIHLLSDRSVHYLVDYVDYSAPVFSRGTLGGETRSVQVGHSGSNIIFDTVLMEGKHINHPERQTYLELLLQFVGKGKKVILGGTLQECANFTLTYDVRQPLKYNYLSSYWKRTFNSMNTGYCGRIINFLDALIFVLSFLLMIVGLIEVYFHCLHLYQYVLHRSGFTVSDYNTIARLTSTAGAHGKMGMVKVFLMVMFTIPAVIFGSAKHAITGGEPASIFVATLLNDYAVLQPCLPKYVSESYIFKNDLNGDGNSKLLEIVKNRRYYGDFQGKTYESFLEEIKKFSNDAYLKKTLTQANWNLALINLREKSDPGNDERERLYFQDKLGNPNIIEQATNYLKKVVQIRKSTWKVTYNQFVYELLQIGTLRNFYLSIDAYTSLRRVQRLESIYEVFGKRQISEESRSESADLVWQMAAGTPEDVNNAKFLRVVQGIFSVIVICAYIVPTSASLAATIALTHGVAIPVLYVFFFLFPHDFRGIFEGIYDLGFYGAYLTSSRCKDLNIRNMKVLDLMLHEFHPTANHGVMRSYKDYKEATIEYVGKKAEFIHIGGTIVPVVAMTKVSTAAKIVGAGIAGFKRHLHMLFPFFKYQTLGIAAGVWKTSFLVKLLAVPGNYWNNAHVGFSHIAAMFNNQPDWTSGF